MFNSHWISTTFASFDICLFVEQVWELERNMGSVSMITSETTTVQQKRIIQIHCPQTRSRFCSGVLPKSHVILIKRGSSKDVCGSLLTHRGTKARTVEELGFWQSGSESFGPELAQGACSHFTHCSRCQGYMSKQYFNLLFGFDLQIAWISFIYVSGFLDCSEVTITTQNIIDRDGQQIELSNLFSNDSRIAGVLQHWAMTALVNEVSVTLC